MVRLMWMAPLLVVALSHGAVVADVDIGPGSKHSSVVLKGIEGSPGHHRRHKGAEQGRHNDLPKSGCTYSGMYIVCPTPGPAPAGAVFTPDMAQSAVENLPMPALALHVQPAGP